MKWSKTHLFTLKEAPADAEIESHVLMIRSGLIKKHAPGIYTYGVLALRSIRKFEAIIREELNAKNCQEVLMPMVQPAGLWQESERWDQMGDIMLRFKNRGDQDFCLGATHEEVVTDYIRHEIKSYRNLPVNIYQIQTKYRDEIRPRFGLMRGREFIMKDAYSFDRDQEGALSSYEDMYVAYKAIFERLGLEFRIVKADTGAMGGDQSHEFQVLAEAGEDHLMVSDGDDGFAANIEVAEAIDSQPFAYNGGGDGADELPLQEFATPKLRTISDLAKSLSVEERCLVKTMFFDGNSGENEKDRRVKPVVVLLRGDDEVNPHKLKTLLKLSNLPLMLNDKEVLKLTSASPGSCGPVGLLKVPIYMDRGMESYKNYVVGANKDDAHLKNVNHGRDFQVTKVADLRMAREGDLSPDGKGQLKSIRGIEVGHIFYLGNKYSQSMGANYLDKNGKPQLVEMGCYGIGVTRTVQAAIEQSHDKDGIVWPVSIAPFHLHMCVLDPDDPDVSGVAERFYQELSQKGVEVFMDDRKERPGVKFKDADLLGFPLRAVIGKRGLQGDQIELVERASKNKTLLNVENFVNGVSSWLESRGGLCR